MVILLPFTDNPEPSTERVKLKNNARRAFVRRQGTNGLRFSHQMHPSLVPKTAQKQQHDQNSHNIDEVNAPQCRETIPLSLLGLPRELRDDIYEWAMVDFPSRIYIPKNEVLSRLVLLPKVLPQLCFTNKQIFLEARLAFVRRTRFCLQDDHAAQTWLMKWLSQFPDDQGFQAIRQLTYEQTTDWYLRSGRSDSFGTGLISKCKGLKSLILNVDVMYFDTGEHKSKHFTLTGLDSTLNWQSFFKNEFLKLNHLEFRSDRFVAGPKERGISSLFKAYMQSFEDEAVKHTGILERRYTVNERQEICEFRWAGPRAQGQEECIEMVWS